MYTQCKHQELKAHIDSCSHAPDIIALTEAKRKHSVKDWNPLLYTLHGYNMESANMNPSDIGRGMLLYLKKELSYIVPDFSAYQVQEMQAVELSLGQGAKATFVSLYRKPNSSQDNLDNLNAFIRQFGFTSNDHLIIAGDTNFPKIDWVNMTHQSESGNKEFEFIEAVRDAYLVQHIDQPTRAMRNDRPSLLDILLTDEFQPTPEIEHCAPLGKSDHNLIKVSFKINCQHQVTQKKRRNLKRGNYNRMKQVLSIDWEQTLEEVDGAEAKWNKFKDILKAACERCIPEIKIRRGHTKKIPVDKKTLSKIRRKKRLWRNFLESRNPEVYNEYCRVRNQVRSATRKNIMNTEKRIASSIKENPKNFWNYVSQKTKIRETIPQLLKEDGSYTTSDEGKVNELSTFFHSVFTDEPPGNWLLPTRPNTRIEDELVITMESVQNELSTLDINKSQGPDELHPRILYEMKDIIAKPLATIFNASLNEGKVPQDWREANISAIHKKGDKKKVNNYRPVSLTSVCCKLMEKCIRKRIMTYLLENDLLSKKQYGFISGRSTLLQLLKVLDKWTTALDSGHEVDIIFLDFKKAFDSVPHNRMVNILHQYGISGKIGAWIKAFLHERKQRVVLQGTASSWENVISGIPQGSVLGPVLFIIYINSLPETSTSDIFLFADDAKIFRTITKVEDQELLQADLDNAQDWSRKSLLNFNRDKCAKMTLSTKSGQSNRNYIMDGQPLADVSSERDLGVIIDSSLSFDEHVSAKIRKANSIMGLIRKTFTYLDKRTFLLLFKSLVRPHLEYNNQLWMPYLKRHIRAIENVQRRATRQIPGMKDKSYEERLRELQLPTLEYRRRSGDMIEVYKIASGKYDCKVTENFLHLNPRTSRSNPFKLQVQRARLNVRKNFITIRAVND